MKIRCLKNASLLPLVFCVATSAFGLDQVFLDPVQPVSPSLKAMGGVSTSNAQGYDALVVNPAAFADNDLSVTFFSLETTTHLPLSAVNQVLDAHKSWQNFDLLAADNPMRKLVNDLVTKTGVGQEASVGMGWVGKNLGLGVMAQVRGTAKGPSLLETKAVFDQTYMGIVGMAWPFTGALGTLQLGGAIRPLQRTYSLVRVGDILDNMGDLAAYSVSTGFGLGLDLGAKWKFQQFETGLAIRDASGTVLNFKDYGAQRWLSSLTLPSGGSSSGNTLYRIPTVIGLGSTWTPEVGSLGALFQPSVTWDLQIPLKDEFSQPSFWTWTHIGLEAKLLKFVSVRTGLNQGYVTFGLGAKALLFDVNLAVFSDEMGRYSGLDRRAGISLEGAIRL